MKILGLQFFWYTLYRTLPRWNFTALIECLFASLKNQYICNSFYTRAFHLWFVWNCRLLGRQDIFCSSRIAETWVGCPKHMKTHTHTKNMFRSRGFETHAAWKSNERYWNRPKTHILAIILAICPLVTCMITEVSGPSAIAKWTSAGFVPKPASCAATSWTTFVIAALVLASHLAESEIGDNFYGWRGVDFRIPLMFSGFAWKMGVLVQPHFGHLCGAVLLFVFSARKTTFWGEHKKCQWLQKMNIICY